MLKPLTRFHLDLGKSVAIFEGERKRQRGASCQVTEGHLRLHPLWIWPCLAECEDSTCHGVLLASILNHISNPTHNKTNQHFNSSLFQIWILHYKTHSYVNNFYEWILIHCLTHIRFKHQNNKHEMLIQVFYHLCCKPVKTLPRPPPPDPSLTPIDRVLPVTSGEQSGAGTSVYWSPVMSGVWS